MTGSSGFENWFRFDDIRPRKIKIFFVLFMLVATVAGSHETNWERKGEN